MSDSTVDLLKLQVQQLLIRVDILEKKVIELEKSGNHGTFEDFELVTSACQGPGSSRTSSNSSAYNALPCEIVKCQIGRTESQIL